MTEYVLAHNQQWEEQNTLTTPQLIVARPVVVDDELLASQFFCVVCGWQWMTKTQRGTPSVAIGSKCFPWLWRDVETRHVTLDDVFIAQFGSASSTRRVIELRTRRKGYPWAGDHLPYGGRGLASADVTILW